MIIDHRVYTVRHGRLPEYLKRFEVEALPVQLRHLGHLVGFFANETGTMNQVTHLWAYADMADRERRRAALYIDPEWRKFADSMRDIFVSQECRLMRPVAFSPLR